MQPPASSSAKSRPGSDCQFKRRIPKAAQPSQPQPGARNPVAMQHGENLRPFFLPIFYPFPLLPFPRRPNLFPETLDARRQTPAPSPSQIPTLILGGSGSAASIDRTHQRPGGAPRAGRFRGRTEAHGEDRASGLAGGPSAVIAARPRMGQPRRGCARLARGPGVMRPLAIHREPLRGSLLMGGAGPGSSVVVISRFRSSGGI